MDTGLLVTYVREVVQTLPFRGRRSRNKVSVGEPAEGSLSFLHPHLAYRSRFGELCASETTRGLPVLAWRVSASRRSRTLLRQIYKRLCGRAPRLVLPLRARSPPNKQITQLLSVDILAR